MLHLHLWPRVKYYNFDMTIPEGNIYMSQRIDVENSINFSVRLMSKFKRTKAVPTSPKIKLLWVEVNLFALMDTKHFYWKKEEM